MNPINNQSGSSILKKLFYPIVTLIFIIIIITVFIIVSRFLSKQLNQPFTANQDSMKDGSLGVNSEDVKVVEDRLSNNGTSTETNGQNPSSSSTTENQTPEKTTTDITNQTNPDQTTQQQTTNTQTTENNSTTTPKIREDKTLLNISILNSTKTNGLAGNLKKTLEQNGYKNITAGNTDTPSDHTVIKIGSSTKSQYETTLKELLSILQTQYPNTQIEEDNQLPAGTETQIIIGSK